MRAAQRAALQRRQWHQNKGIRGPPYQMSHYAMPPCLRLLLRPPQCPLTNNRMAILRVLLRNSNGPSMRYATVNQGRRLKL